MIEKNIPSVRFDGRPNDSAVNFLSVLKDSLKIKMLNKTNKIKLME